MDVCRFSSYGDMCAVAGVPHSIFHPFIVQMLKFDDLTLMAEAHPRPVSKRAKLVSGRVCPMPSNDRARLGRGAGGAPPPQSQWGKINLSKNRVEGTRVIDLLY